jgi:radical SAM superfamily enzyme YgiQ (UPF0313 family)
MTDGSLDRGATPANARMKSSAKIWIADLTYTQQQISAELIPQAIGGIATFLETRLDLAEPVRLFKYPEVLAAALETEFPDIIGFSNYVWNSNLSLAFASRMKELSPDVIVVFGGPHYPIVAQEQEKYIRDHAEFDFYIVKEGEVAFANLVLALVAAGFDKEAVKALDLASVHSIDGRGGAHLTGAVERLRDLTEIPSPYVLGRLDEFFDGKLLPIIQTNRGCPFSCTFCVEGISYYNKIYRNGREKVAAEVDYIGRKMQALRAKGGRNDLFVADSNFGMYKDDIETCREIAKAQDSYGWPEYINVATGKNQKARVLESARLVRGAIRLSGSVQSLDETVLKNVKRDNIAADQLMKLALEAAEVDANSYSEVILGLPGDSREAHCRTLRTVIDAGFQKVIPYTMMMLPGSEMCTEESKQKYQMALRFRVLPRCFGHFDICGERVVSAEIEEVCVATASLPYADYLDCRKLHLMISIFYNDAVFSALLRFLKVSGVSVFRWLEILRDRKIGGRFGELVERFEQATRNELWGKREELEAHAMEPGVIERYITGELGLNLLFTYKSIAMTHHISELRELACETVAELMQASGLGSPEILEFVDDLVSYDSCRMTNLFADLDQDVQTTFRYDVESFMRKPWAGTVEDYELTTPVTLQFTLDADQRATINRGLGLFGSDQAGVGRILSKFHITRLLRRPARELAGDPRLSAAASHAAPVPINLLDA